MIQTGVLSYSEKTLFYVLMIQTGVLSYSEKNQIHEF